MSTVKSDFAKTEDAAKTRVDLDVIAESDLATEDPAGNQRSPTPIREMPYREHEYFQTQFQPENRAASKPRDHAGVPTIQTVKINDADEIGGKK